MNDYISTRLFVATAVMVATMAIGTSALAQSDDNNESMRQVMPFGFGPFGGAAGMITRPVDTNGDGFVTASEASDHASAGFAEFDTDGDDQITEDEYLDSTPFGMPIGRRNVERLYVNRTARFKTMDADGDTKVTLAEFMAKAQASFESADANTDGKVTVWEFRAQQNPF